MSARTCAHSACLCEVDPEQMYCSESCREAARVPLPEVTGCGCGHKECLGAAGKAGDEALQEGSEEADAARRL